MYLYFRDTATHTATTHYNTYCITNCNTHCITALQYTVHYHSATPHCNTTRQHTLQHTLQRTFHSLQKCLPQCHFIFATRSRLFRKPLQEKLFCRSYSAEALLQKLFYKRAARKEGLVAKSGCAAHVGYMSGDSASSSHSICITLLRGICMVRG